MASASHPFNRNDGGAGGEQAPPSCVRQVSSGIQVTDAAGEGDASSPSPSLDDTEPCMLGLMASPMESIEIHWNKCLRVENRES
ncbi:hypothetical protein EYF80_040058 [Liparis tanakae]|uniref:Uncharacterized protein n=1 Tax=Liparis tanakae TaxID=230148 RepID=A0A4Z2G882_9TELE|nr:hypothetical protein EYF80_040058 [Liparis tanakae]